MIERVTKSLTALVDRLPTLNYKYLLFPPMQIALIRIYLGMAASFFLFGFFYPYWRFADMDFMLTHQGLLFNDGQPQDYFDHTAYPYYLGVGTWYWLLHWGGLLPVHAISELPPSTDVGAFNAAWQHLIEAGRLLSLFATALFVGTFTLMLRRFISDPRIAVLGGFALAFSGSVAMHMRIMRTELLSAGFAITALLAVLIATREDVQLKSRSLLLGIAGLCATLAVVTKIQALILVVAIPMIALAFSRPSGRRSSTFTAEPPTIGWHWVLGLGLVALALAIPAAQLFLRGLAEAAQSIFPYRPLGVIPDGTYQAAIAIWVPVAMVAYAAIRRVPLPEAVTALAAVLIGISLGLLSLEIKFNEQNLLAVTHPIEHLFVFATSTSSELGRESQVISQSLFALLARGMGSAMAAHTFVLRPSSRPTLMLEWVTIIGAVILWRRGERTLPLQVGLLIVLTWLLDTVFTLRGLKLEYLVYTDPLLIIACALVAARFPILQDSLQAQKIAVCLFVLYFAWAHTEPIKPLFSHSGPEENCWWIPYYVKSVDKFPFCRT